MRVCEYQMYCIEPFPLIENMLNSKLKPKEGLTLRFAFSSSISGWSASYITELIEFEGMEKRIMVYH